MEAAPAIPTTIFPSKSGDTFDIPLELPDWVPVDPGTDDLMPAKVCSKCGLYKPFTEYYHHPTSKDNLLYLCKDCAKTAQYHIRQRKLEKYREYSRMKSRSEEGRRRAAEDRKKHPDRYHARYLANVARRKGILIPQPCEICGSIDHLEMHHDDYSKPLEVMWLCRPCHRKKDNSIKMHLKHVIE